VSNSVHALISLRRSFLASSLLLLAACASGVSAQTAPQLLPYTARLIAGGGATATFTVGNSTTGPFCPVAGAPNFATDTFGDGCLATEVQLTAPRYAVSDKKGNVFFGDYTNALVRRVDAVTGIITAVAGGGSGTLVKGSPCTTGTTTPVSSDSLGDGCLGTQVRLGTPAGVAFDAAGNLYFSDPYDYNVREIAATNGLVPATGGVISLIDGDDGGTTISYGYTSNFGTTTINAATSSYLDGPMGISADAAGNLYISDYYKNAILIVNTNTTGSTTVTGVAIPAGTVAKIAGTVSGGGTVCPNSPASTNGCNYGLFVSGTAANASLLDDPFAASADSAGNVYFANEYENDVAIISSTGTINNFAGTEGGLGTIAKGLSNTTRGTAGTFNIGASFGVAADNYPAANVYIPDSTNGLIWRVDGATKSMYAVAGGATTPCGATTDGAIGDGCPALQATFSSNGTYGVTKAPGISGVYGISVDTNANLFVADQKNNLIREVASGGQFGIIGANQPTDILDVHFAPGDTPAAATPYVVATGATYFTVGTPTCTKNSDTTTDCLVPVKATVTTTGTYSGSLAVTSVQGATSTFPLSAQVVTGPKTSTVISAVSATCTGTSTFATTLPINLTATLISNGTSVPTGSFTFYGNGVPLNTTPVAITNIGTAGAPVYGAILSYTFSTPGTYAITARYSGDSYYITSTSSPTTIVSSLPTYTMTAVGNPTYTVVPGQTALYSFTVPSVYIGTVSFTVTGLPANSSYSLSPTGGLTLNGCSTSSTIALSILTQAQTVVQPAAIGSSGRGPWQILSLCAGLALALLLAIRRRRLPALYGNFGMMLALLLALSGATGCGKAVGTVIQPATPASPAGNPYQIVVTATGTSGTAPAPITFYLTVQ
jgi:hypothetical protein